MTKGEGVLDWNDPAPVVHNRVRGLQPWPLASATLGGERYVIRRSAPLTEETAQPPGTVIRAHGDDLVIACGHHTALRVLDIQPEGRRTMTAREFLAGRGVAEGARFES
jgi:methionyl-tRNA formyltransferase